MIIINHRENKLILSLRLNKIKQTIILNNINLLNSIFVNPDIENTLNISGLEENPEIFYNISDFTKKIAIV